MDTLESSKKFWRYLRPSKWRRVTLRRWQAFMKWRDFGRGAHLVSVSNVILFLLGGPRLGLCITITAFFNPMPFAGLSSPAVALAKTLGGLSAWQLLISLADLLATTTAVCSYELTPIKRGAFFFTAGNSVTVATVILVLQSLLVSYPFDLEAAFMDQQDSTRAEIQTYWNNATNRALTISVFVLSTVLAMTQASAVCLRHLVASPWRLRVPQQYQPFVMERHQAAETEMSELPKEGSYAAYARQYELEWDKRFTKEVFVLSREKANAFGRRTNLGLRTARENHRDRTLRHPSSEKLGIPHVDPFDRYWATERTGRRLRLYALPSVLYALLAPPFEIARFVLDRRAGRSCQWTCGLSITYPWPFTVWVVTTFLLFRCRVGFQIRIIGSMQLWTVLVMCWLVALALCVAAAVLRGISWNSNSVPYHTTDGIYYLYPEPNGSAFVYWNVQSFVFAYGMAFWLLFHSFFRTCTWIKRKFGTDWSQYLNDSTHSVSSQQDADQTSIAAQDLDLA